MAISEAARHDLYTGLSELLGPERTETLMSALPIYDLDEVATKGDIAELRTATKGDIAELRAATKGDIAELRTATKGDIAELRAATKGDIAELRTELKGDIAELRAATKGDIAELRTELKGDIGVMNARLHTLEAGITAIGSRLDDQTQRLDKLILTQYAGLVAFAAALIGILITR